MIWGSKEIKEVDRYDELESLVWDFFMKKIPRLGFEQREGQEDMALDICYSIKERKHTIIEAGVGIGKSYAYIVPLLLYNQLFKKPVLIATSTIALQEQLMKDVRQIARYLQLQPEIVLAKGMTHFVCKHRVFQRYQQEENLSENEQYLYEYAKKGVVERKRIPLNIDEELWEQVTIKATDHSRCEHFTNCKFMELREEMLETKGIILCNQDLLTVHLQKLKKGQKGLLSNHIDLIVIDEAHNIEEKVRNSLIESYTQQTIKYLIKDAIGMIRNVNIKRLLTKESYQCDQLIGQLFDGFHKQIKMQMQENRKIQNQDIEKFFIDIKAIRANLLEVQRKLKDIYQAVVKHSDKNINEDIVAELQNVNIFFSSLLDEKSNSLFWLEKNKSVEIFACPKNIDKEISKLYFDQTKTTILTSATIAHKNSGSEEERYEYFIKSTGFKEKNGFLAQPKYSPFPYNENALIYYTNDMPHPTHERKTFIEKGTDEIIKLLEITEGKALILFTSKNDLNEVYQLLKHKNLPYTLLKQNELSSQNEIIDAFKEDINSVLLATGTFWEGIDVPGKALSNLIIFRLPFPVPDPIHEYKKKISKDYFMEVSVPHMVVKLRQGVGRLIRNHTDKGIVAILDSRVGDKVENRYKELVFEALPMKNKVTSLNEVKAFVAKKEI